MLKICGTAGPSSGNLFLDLEGEGLARECISEGVAVVPAADERVSFEEDIKPLFRPTDLESMSWAFDARPGESVRGLAVTIGLLALLEGTREIAEAVFRSHRERRISRTAHTHAEAAAS